MKYMASSQDKPSNCPLYSVHLDMESFILYNNDCVENEVSPLEAEVSITKIIKFNTEEENPKGEDL